MTKFIAVFLQWKAGFFSTEFTVETGHALFGHGNFDFLREIFREPEKIMLATVALVGSGVALQFIPTLPSDITVGDLEIPNPYAEAVNVFIEEAAHCAHGTIPLTGLEYGFLGLKFGLLTVSLLSGSHSANYKELDFVKLFQDLKKQKVLDLAESKRAELISNVLAEHGILPLAKQEKDSIYQELHKKILDAVNSTAALIQKPKPAAPEFDATLKPAHDAWVALKDAMGVVNQMEMLGEEFDSGNDARLFYDHLNSLFDHYNREVATLGRQDKGIDKREFMQSFYNKHCYGGSNTLLRIISIIPFYPLTCLWRGIKYAFATSERFQAPSMAHQVEKSFDKDKAMLLQVLAVGSRILRAAVRAYTYTLRFVLGVVAACATLTVVLWFESSRNWLDAQLSKIAFHRFEGSSWLRQKYANYTRDAGTNDDLRVQAVRLEDQLRVCDPSEFDIVTNKTYTDILAACTEHDKDSLKQLQRVSALVNTTDDRITLEEKARKINNIGLENRTNKTVRGVCANIAQNLQLGMFPDPTHRKAGGGAAPTSNPARVPLIPAESHSAALH